MIRQSFGEEPRSEGLSERPGEGEVRSDIAVLLDSWWEDGEASSCIFLSCVLALFL